MELQKLADDIWLAEGGIVSFYGFPYPTRSVIVRLGGPDLWIWSPVALSPALRDSIDAIGSVAHLVSPNKIHHLCLGDWKAAYPAAQLWGPLSTIEKRTDLAFAAPLRDDPPPAWASHLQQAWFRGSFVMDEIVFCHRASRTVIIADLIENFSEGFLRQYWSWWQRPLARLDGITTHSARAPLEWRLSFFDRAPARAARDKMLAWNAERVVMAHGEWQPSNGRAFLARSFSWLGA